MNCLYRCFCLQLRWAQQVLLLGFAVACPMLNSLQGQDPDELPTSSLLENLNIGDGIDQLLTRVALAHIPQEYTDDKNWGMQMEKKRGVEFREQDGRLVPRRKSVMVNHGSWKKYTASLRNPEEEFQIQIANLRELPDGGIGLELLIDAHLDFEARQVEWKNGTRLLSLTVVGHTRVSAQVDFKVSTEFVGSKFLPDVIIRPTAENVHLTLSEFRIDRIGKIGGEVAQQVGREAQKQLRKRLPEQEQKALQKINQQFDKKPDGYRFSFSETQKSKLKDSFDRLSRQSK